MLLLQVLLLDATGRSPHSELVLMEARVPWKGERSGRHLRSFAKSLLDERWTSIVAAVDRQTDGSLEAARQQQAVVIGRLQHRDRAMLQGLPSAARRLVQAGLFDRRALEAMDKARRADALMVEDAAVRADADAAALQAVRTIRLVAARIGARR
jgi:hypothetical protein